MAERENQLRSADQKGAFHPPGEESRNAFLQALCDSVREECALLDEEGSLIYATDRLEALVERDGRPQEERAENPEFVAYIDRIRRISYPLAEQEFALHLPGGKGHGPDAFRTRVKPVTDGSGRQSGYVVVARPLPPGGARRVGTDHTSCGGDTLAQHEKLVALGTIAAGIAHEIGNPLASLSAVVQLLKRKVRSGEIADHLDTLNEQIQRIARIVRQMLSFSRPSSQERTVTDVNELIEKTVDMVGYSRKAQELDIRVAGSEELPRLRIMPQLFQQVLVNLLLNAADAVSDQDEDGIIEVTPELQDGWVCIGVEDNGEGMTREEQEHAVDPFYTTKPAGEGTGLGLAVSYRLVQREGGDLSIDSRPGEGTRVAVYLPMKLAVGRN